MTLIHIVLLKFKPEVTQKHKETFLSELKTLKNSPHVKDGRLIVGGFSMTDEWSKGFEFASISYHENLASLRQYQASDEHHRITSTYMFPFDESLCSFDFEVDPEDEYMCGFSSVSILAGMVTGNKIPIEDEGQEIVHV